MERYITKGIHNTVSPLLQNSLWELTKIREKHPDSDYLHVFTITKNKDHLTITHTQESPPYTATHSLSHITLTKEMAKIYVVRTDDCTSSYYVMLLPEEY